jgi:hypothetical protein
MKENLLVRNVFPFTGSEGEATNRDLKARFIHRFRPEIVLGRHIVQPRKEIPFTLHFCGGRTGSTCDESLSYRNAIEPIRG